MRQAQRPPGTPCDPQKKENISTSSKGGNGNENIQNEGRVQYLSLSHHRMTIDLFSSTSSLIDLSFCIWRLYALNRFSFRAFIKIIGLCLSDSFTAPLAQRGEELRPNALHLPQHHRYIKPVATFRCLNKVASGSYIYTLTVKS
jgi:hypothetical protein